MRTKIEKAGTLKFLLQGKIGSYQDCTDGPDTFVGENFEEVILAATPSEAIEKARERTQVLLKQYASLAPPSAPSGWESTYDFTLTQQLWSKKFVPEGSQIRVRKVPAHIREVVSV